LLHLFHAAFPVALSPLFSASHVSQSALRWLERSPETLGTATDARTKLLGDDTCDSRN
jgi:hypothetical protein